MYLDQTFHALSDGTRRAMIGMLSRRLELTASELGKPFDMSQPAASKHLRVLEQAGLLVRRIEGRTHRFRLAEKRLQEAERWISRHRDFWEGNSRATRRRGRAQLEMASQLGVIVRRRIRAPRPDVYRAFAAPSMLERWFSPSPDIRTEVLEHDFRIGGRYRFGFVFPGGGRDTVLGEFRELEPPARLVFTWGWEPPDRHAGIETLVTIALREIDGETEVVVTHDRFPSHDSRDRHEVGWATTLDRLQARLAEEQTG